MTRKGFTLVELLVVIAIIGILVALLLPAVQAAREAARRIRCVNNFKQVGIAMHNYHDALKSFPSGINMYHRGSCGAPSSTAPDYGGWSWSTYSLPFYEERALHDLFERFKETGYGDPKSYKAGQHFVTTYLCPSDPQGAVLVGYGSGTFYAKTNQAGIAHSSDYTCNGLWVRRNGDGMLFNGSRVKIRNVTDGTSHTLMVGEVVGMRPGTNEGMAWITWNIHGTGNGINLDVPWKTTWTGFGSYHPGGCHFLLVDGSVQFIGATIDRWTLAYLTTRAGGETFEPDFK